MAIDTHIYFLPFYFQAVKGTSAQGSGIRILPYFISVTLTTVVIGSCVSYFRVYVPFMWVSVSLLTVGCTLLHSLQVETSAARWIGYQILTGVAFGMGFQIPYTAVQVVLSPEDLPTGNALIVFFQTLGGGLAVSIAQNVFISSLVKGLSNVPQIHPATLIAQGVSELRGETPPEALPAVLEALNLALSKAFIIPIVGAGSAFLCSLAMERRMIRKNKGIEDNNDRSPESKSLFIIGCPELTIIPYLDSP